MVEAPAKSGFGFFARLFRPKPAPPTPPVCQHDWTDLPEGYRLCKPCSRLERWDRGMTCNGDGSEHRNPTRSKC